MAYNYFKLNFFLNEFCYSSVTILFSHKTIANLLYVVMTLRNSQETSQMVTKLYQGCDCFRFSFFYSPSKYCVNNRSTYVSRDDEHVWRKQKILNGEIVFRCIAVKCMLCCAIKCNIPNRAFDSIFLTSFITTGWLIISLEKPFCKTKAYNEQETICFYYWIDTKEKKITRFKQQIGNTDIHRSLTWIGVKIQKSFYNRTENKQNAILLSKCN